MSSGRDNPQSVAEDYERSTGGVTKCVAQEILAIYSNFHSLEGKTVLDNACGSGVVTKEILSHARKVNIEAADISPSMI